MSKHLLFLIEQLDRAVDEILTQPEPAVPLVDPQIAALLPLIGDLRGLPGPNFKARLRADLERSGNDSYNATHVRNKEEIDMSVTKVNPVPAGFHTVQAYVTVPGAAELIEWLKQVAGAQERFRTTGSAGGIHCEMQVGDSMLMIGGGPTITKSMPTAFHLVTDEVDQMYDRAMQAGATSMGEPSDQAYGERVAGVKDPSGNEWYFAKEIGDSGMHRGLRTLNVYLHPVGTPKFIDFLKDAFDAESAAVFASPEGLVHHAKIRVGDSILEMGEAHGPYQPMATCFYLYVPDCDAVYEKAIRAGAKSIAPPTDHPYGDRSGGVEDPFGNTWYIATHIRDV